MTLLNIAEGIRLEEARRAPPLDDKGHSLRFAEADREYQDWLRLHGRLLLHRLKLMDDELLRYQLDHPQRII